MVMLTSFLISIASGVYNRIHALERFKLACPKKLSLQFMSQIESFAKKGKEGKATCL